MGFLGVHAIAYGTVSVLLVLIWLMTGGSPQSLARPVTAAQQEGFWPLWPIAAWGTFVAGHAALTLLLRRQRRRRRVRREARGPEGPHWITAMFTDICGSTRLVDELGDEAYSELITRHRRMVRELAAAHRGREIGTQGDGFLLRFPSPREASTCAVELQRRMAQERERDPLVPFVRIGVHAGEVIARDGDVLGRMVNIASRVADTAAPGEILVTEPVADHSGTEPALFEDRGLQQLRGVEGARHLLAVRWTSDGEVAPR